MVDQRIEFHQERSFIYEMNIVHILDIWDISDKLDLWEHGMCTYQF